MAIYLTSDTHAFHRNTCAGLTTWKNGSVRNFADHISMTEAMADRINSTVGADDTLYHLGDWSFGGKDKVEVFRSMINCKNIHLVLGNHDHHIIQNASLKSLFSSVRQYLEITINKQMFVLFHYPIGSWNGIGKGSIQAHGHCHGSYKYAIGRQIDVGCDTNNLTPYSLEEIVDRMRKVSPVLVDHHDESSNLR